VGWAPRVSVGRSGSGSGNVSVLAPSASSGTVVVDSDGEKKSIKEQVEERKEIYKAFLADYGMLIGQLSAGQKIMITEKSNNDREQLYVRTARAYKSDREDEVDIEIDPQVSAEITVSDIDAFKLGKLSRDQLLGKVDITVSEKSSEVVRDIEIFANMIKTVFSSELTESYWTSWKPNYHRLENVGVVFSMQVYSSYSEDQGYRMPSLGIKSIKEPERNEKVKELYPKFLEDLKASIVDYGRTLKSVDDDELIMFKVKMTKCDGCGLPENLELSIKMSVLNSYASGKLSRTQALQAVKVKG